MSVPMIVAIVLAAAVALGAWRTGIRWPLSRKARALRIVLQIAAALLLYGCLFPPATREDFAAGELVVLTPGATSAQLRALPLAANVVALPGVDAPRAIERVPDVGTALRRHADARSLRIVGAGLPSRDRDAARGLVSAFDAVPPSRGLVELDAPASVGAGSLWQVQGRAQDSVDGRVELRDPAGTVVAAQTLDAQGRFILQTTAKGEGTAQFTLRLLDRDGAQIDAVPVPLAVHASVPLRILLLGGAPDPELKYLRRWAADAELALDSRMILSEGVAFTEGAPALDGDALRRADVVIVDERAWAAIDARHKQTLIAAVRDGLGLLLRVTGPLPAPVAADWAELGYPTRADESAAAVRLDRRFALADPGIALTRRALTVEAPDAAPLLRADDGSVLAWSRNLGHGRVGLWQLSDGYRLSLSGAGAAFGTMWGDALAGVARARGEAVPTLPATARVDERAVSCGIADDTSIEDDSGERTVLTVDATTHCAAYWPATAGWHNLFSAGRSWPFYARARGEAAALAAGEAAHATRAMIGSSASVAATATRSVPLPRWPFFLTWLAAAAALWWLERSRHGVEAERGD